MGRDALVYIPKGNQKKAIIEQLRLLNFKKIKDFYYCGDDSEFKHYSGVRSWFVDVDNDEKEEYNFILAVRTQFAANAHDISHQNFTLKHLKNYFNTHFQSDYGKNRYFPYDGNPNSFGAENGCFFAIDKLENNFVILKNSLRNYPDDSEQELLLPTFGIPSPSIFTANIYLTYLCSIIEQYFKLTFIAILKFSKNKEQIFKKGSRFFPFDLASISNGTLSIEEAFANTLSFQNIEKINSNFKMLDSKLDVSSSLKKPYMKRKENLYEALNRILEQRHGLIHQININLTYSKYDFLKDVDCVNASLLRVYDYLCQTYSWENQLT